MPRGRRLRPFQLVSQNGGEPQIINGTWPAQPSGWRWRGWERLIDRLIGWMIDWLIGLDWIIWTDLIWLIDWLIMRIRMGIAMRTSMVLIVVSIEFPTPPLMPHVFLLAETASTAPLPFFRPCARSFWQNVTWCRASCLQIDWEWLGARSGY